MKLATEQDFQMNLNGRIAVVTGGTKGYPH